MISPPLPPILQQFMDGEDKENNLGGGMVEIVTPGDLDHQLQQQISNNCNTMLNSLSSEKLNRRVLGSNGLPGQVSNGGNLVNSGGAKSKTPSRESGEKHCVSFDPNPTILLSSGGCTQGNYGALCRLTAVSP